MEMEIRWKNQSISAWVQEVEGDWSPSFPMISKSEDVPPAGPCIKSEIVFDNGNQEDERVEEEGACMGNLHDSVTTPIRNGTHFSTSCGNLSAGTPTPPATDCNEGLLKNIFGSGPTAQLKEEGTGLSYVTLRAKDKRKKSAHRAHSFKTPDLNDKVEFDQSDEDDPFHLNEVIKRVA
ncbi:hypothetical protein Hanom_Chr17g01558141 [Helianthus anomalus]